MAKRYVWNARMPEWGYGLVRSESGRKLDILFEYGGKRLMQQGFAGLEDVDPDNIDDDSPLHDRKQWRRLESQKAFRAEFGRMLTRFLTVFPQGFADPAFTAAEREEKLQAIAYAAAHFSPEALQAARAEGGGAVVASIMTAVTMTNLIHPRWERARLAAIPDEDHDAFADAFIHLLHGPGEYADRLADFADFLKPYSAAKWTIATYFGFLLHPETRPFVKPDAVRYVAKALKRDLRYAAHPTASIWRRIVELYADVADRLTAAGHPPADTIDTQTFLWIGGPGYEQASKAAAPKAAAPKAAAPKAAAPKAAPKPPAPKVAPKPPAKPPAPVMRKWTEAEHGALVEAYFWMQAQERQGRPVDRAAIYAELEAGPLSGHSSQEVRRAMLHVSAALAAVNRPHLDWLAPPAEPDAKLRDALTPIVRTRLTTSRTRDAPTADQALLHKHSHDIAQTLTRRPPGRRHPEKLTQSITTWKRDPAVRAWVMRRAAGRCELCEESARYMDIHSTFLQLFRLQPFSEGGPDTVENTAAICPNCLQVAQNSQSRTIAAAQLRARVSELV